MEYKHIPLAAARIKAAPGAARALDVYASTFVEEPDAYGDVVERGAFARTLREKGTTRIGLRDHVTTQVIGSITNLREDDFGLRGLFSFVEGVQLSDETFLLAKAGALTGVSIGYNVFPGGSRIVDGIRRISAIDLAECSMTAWPANDTARVVENDDAKALAASLNSLNTSMKALNDKLRAERKTDPLVQALEAEFKKLAAARSMWGDAHPATQAIAKHVQEQLERAQLRHSIERLHNTIRNVA